MVDLLHQRYSINSFVNLSLYAQVSRKLLASWSQYFPNCPQI